MKFCSSCDNMLYLKITEGNDGEDCKLDYCCNHCNKVESDLHETDSCVFQVNFNIDNIKKNAFINKYVYEDVTIPHAEGIKCPNSKCPEQKPEIIYIQYDKENMKYILLRWSKKTRYVLHLCNIGSTKHDTYCIFALHSSKT